MTSLKKRLKARPRPTAVFPLRMSDDTEDQRALVAAKKALFVANFKEDAADEVAEAEKQLDEAQARVDSHYEKLTLTALPPAAFEALVDAHPPTKEQEKEDKDVPWNIDTFRPALLAATVDGDLTAEDWDELYAEGQVNLGEFRRLFQSCLDVNDRSAEPFVGKG
ncbi:hypothetical protein BAY59_10745 [Prauserella coralliicola]|nr:hypothetical protein BAY59_10745 [Prauserella coralliicola]